MLQYLPAMDETKLREMLEAMQQGALSVDEALARLRDLPYEDLGYAELDHHRALRKGFPEVVLGEGKQPEQIAAIAEGLGGRSDRLLVTRVDVETYRLVKERVPDAVYHPAARVVALDRSAEQARPGVAVCCAGTSDVPVAEEAAVTAETMGNAVDRMYDVGVAGLHRLLDKMERLRAAHALVVV